MLEAGAESRIYAGVKPGTTADNLRRAVANGKVADRLAYFTPKPGDAVFIPAGTVHTLGDDVAVFEIQQNSDVTFRLYDWGHVDANTGKPRKLEVDEAIACIDFKNGSADPVSPMVEARTPVNRAEFSCEFFRLWRLKGEAKFTVGAAGEPRVLVCLEGSGQVAHNGSAHAIGKGEVWLLPAESRGVRISSRQRRDLIGNCDPEIVHDRAIAGCGEGRRRQLQTQELKGGGSVKKLIVYDLDGTLAESKSSLDAEMAARLHDLLGIVKVAVISGGGWPQFEKQLLSHLPHDERLRNLSLLPTCGTKFYQYAGDCEKAHEEDFTADQREKILNSFKKALAAAGFKVEKTWGEVIEDRGEPNHVFRIGPAGPLGKQRTNGILITPSARKSKPSLIRIFPSFPSAWVGRHPLISPNPVLIKLTASESSARSAYITERDDLHW